MGPTVVDSTLATAAETDRGRRGRRLGRGRARLHVLPGQRWEVLVGVRVDGPGLELEERDEGLLRSFAAQGLRVHRGC